ncbi:MAG: hypothetical protein RSD49_01500 [Hafnia sp.]
MYKKLPLVALMLLSAPVYAGVLPDGFEPSDLVTKNIAQVTADPVSFEKSSDDLPGVKGVVLRSDSEPEGLLAATSDDAQVVEVGLPQVESGVAKDLDGGSEKIEKILTKKNEDRLANELGFVEVINSRNQHFRSVEYKITVFDQAGGELYALGTSLRNNASGVFKERSYRVTKNESGKKMSFHDKSADFQIQNTVNYDFVDTAISYDFTYQRNVPDAENRPDPYIGGRGDFVITNQYDIKSQAFLKPVSEHKLGDYTIRVEIQPR